MSTIPEPTGGSHACMSISESIVLLVIARLWQEGTRDGAVGNYGTVLTTLNDAYDGYLDIVSRSRRAALRVEEFRSTVGELGRPAIVKLHAFDDQDQELVIRPIAAVLAGDDLLATLEALLRNNPVPSEETTTEDDEALPS